MEASDDILLNAGSTLGSLYGTDRVTEKYRCSYGITPRYLPLFDDSDLRFSGFDAAGEPRAFEHRRRRFFLGTAYQPERSALEERSHPLVDAFVRAAAGELALSA